MLVGWLRRRARGACDTAAMERGNLFAGAEPPEAGELFSEIARARNVVFERIVSSSRPESEVYVQDQDELVLLLSGEAELDVGGKSVRLGPGDWLLLTAGAAHRVVRTSEGALWLAVHVHPERRGAREGRDGDEASSR